MQNLSTSANLSNNLSNNSSHLPKYELVEYKIYPTDQYTVATAIVRVDDRFCLTYCQKKSKDGGFFWTCPSVGVTESSGVKRHLEAFSAERRSEEKALLEFVKESVRAIGSNASQSALASTEGGASNEQLPF